MCGGARAVATVCVHEKKRAAHEHASEDTRDGTTLRLLCKVPVASSKKYDGRYGSGTLTCGIRNAQDDSLNFKHAFCANEASNCPTLWRDLGASVSSARPAREPRRLRAVRRASSVGGAWRTDRTMVLNPSSADDNILLVLVRCTTFQLTALGDLTIPSC